MLILVDSNILLRVAKPDDPQNLLALDALLKLRQKQHELAIVPQCAYEFYVVATRPLAQNGLGLEPTEAIADLEEASGLFRLLRDERKVFETWLELVTTYEVRGKTAHDTRLVAAMQRHGIQHLLTFNVADFRRYEPEIHLLDPRQIEFDDLAMH